MEKNLTQGSIKKLYFRYLGAAFGSSMISCIYGMVDVAVVGQYQGPQGTAALSVVAPIWTILYSLGILTGSGGSIKYTYYRAQGKTDKANAYFTLSLLLTSVIAVVCWIGLTVFDDQLLRLFGADEALLPLAEAYLRPIQFVIPAYPFTQMLAAYLRNDNAPGFAALPIFHLPFQNCVPMQRVFIHMYIVSGRQIFIIENINRNCAHTEASFMWGICLDSKVPEDGRFQAAVQYKIDNSKALVISPKADYELDIKRMYCCSDGSKGGCYPRSCYCRHAFQCDCHDVFHLSFVQKQRTDWQDIKKNR